LKVIEKNKSSNELNIAKSQIKDLKTELVNVISLAKKETNFKNKLLE